MRTHLAAAVAVTILAAFAAKLFFIGTPPVVADTQAVMGSTISIQQMHQQHSKDNLPELDVKDPF